MGVIEAIGLALLLGLAWIALRHRRRRRSDDLATGATWLGLGATADFHADRHHHPGGHHGGHHGGGHDIGGGYGGGDAGGGGI